MGSDIVPGAIFPDYELADHTAKRRKLLELRGQCPMVQVLGRGSFCPKDRPQAEGLVELHLVLEPSPVIYKIYEATGSSAGPLLEISARTWVPLPRNAGRTGTSQHLNSERRGVHLSFPSNRPQTDTKVQWTRSHGWRILMPWGAAKKGPPWKTSSAAW